MQLLAEDRLAEEAQVEQRIQGAASGVVEQAHALGVASAEEARIAAVFLTGIAEERKAQEAARTFLVKPLNDHVKEINARFKPLAERLRAADETVRAKLMGYHAEQARLREEAQALLDAERLRLEAAAEEQRRAEENAARMAAEAAAREAARLRANAEAAARKFQEARERERSERRREIAAMENFQLMGLAESDWEPDVGMANQELRMRALARKRESDAAAAEAARVAAVLLQEEIRAAPKLEIAPAVVSASPEKLAGVSVRKTWEFEVVDPRLLPDDYLSVNLKEIRAAVRRGVRQIPGVRIYEQEGLAVRAP